MRTTLAVVGGFHLATILLGIFMGLFTDRAVSCRFPAYFELARAYRHGWTGGEPRGPLLQDLTTEQLITARDTICRLISARSN